MCLMSYTAHGLAMLQPCLAPLASLVNSSTPSYPALLVACLTLLVCLLIQPCLASFVCLFILFGLTPLVCLLISLTYYYYNYGVKSLKYSFTMFHILTCVIGCLIDIMTLCLLVLLILFYTTWHLLSYYTYSDHVHPYSCASWYTCYSPSSDNYN